MCWLGWPVEAALVDLDSAMLQGGGELLRRPAAVAGFPARPQSVDDVGGTEFVGAVHDGLDVDQEVSDGFGFSRLIRGGDGAAGAADEVHGAGDDGVRVLSGHVVGAHDRERLALGDVLDLPSGHDRARVCAGAQILGAGTARSAASTRIIFAVS